MELLRRLEEVRIMERFELMINRLKAEHYALISRKIFPAMPMDRDTWEMASLHGTNILLLRWIIHRFSGIMILEGDLESTIKGYRQQGHKEILWNDANNHRDQVPPLPQP
jgi:hypothetical protein